MANLNIDKLLKRYKLEQKDLAESTGINKNTINKYFNNKFENINRTHIDLICKYFKCTPNDLFEIDDTVEVEPAKILYYDDKKDDFTYGEIAHAIISPLTWIGSKIVKGAIESTKQPEILDEDVDYESEEFVDPTTLMSPNELAEYTKTVNEQQMRFNSELQIDELVDTFINKIIESYISNISMDDSFKKTFENYKGYDYFTTNLKVKRFHRVLHPFLSIHTKDYALLLLLDDIKNIYDKNGLESLSENKLNELKNSLNYYIDNGIPVIPIKQKD